MQKSKWNDYSYTILLCVSMVFAVILWTANAFLAEKAGNIDKLPAAELEPSTDSIQGVELPENLAIENASEAVNADVSKEHSTEIEAAEEEKQTAVIEEVQAEEQPVIFPADISYFDDALFIGDSRTVGLYEYGGLGKAEVFADTGMNIYKVFTEEFELQNGEMVTLETALQTMDFGKIYIMLGINELGYDFEQTVARFSETIDTILKYQPKAYIFIQANLHITKEKSEESEYFTNSNIDKYNSAISKLADGKQIFYLDANPLYDDEEGYLSTEFTTDHAHILGKYYVDWVDFILQNAVRG